jgi:hypothetical protein
MCLKGKRRSELDAAITQGSLDCISYRRHDTDGADPMWTGRLLALVVVDSGITPRSPCPLSPLDMFDGPRHALTSVDQLGV